MILLVVLRRLYSYLDVIKDEVKRWFGGWEVPLLDERVRRVQEVGAALSEGIPYYGVWLQHV